MPILIDAEVNQLIDDTIFENAEQGITAAADNQLRKKIYANIKKLTGEKVLIEAMLAPGVGGTFFVVELPPLERDRLISVEMKCFAMAFAEDGTSAQSGVYAKRQAVFIEKLIGGMQLLTPFEGVGGNSSFGGDFNFSVYTEAAQIFFKAANPSVYTAIFTGHVIISLSNL